MAQALVKLNIGGVKYTTTLQTLQSRGPNFFTALIENDLSGRLASVRDDKGCYFVDRNGRVFEPILEYLRTGQLLIPPTMSRTAVQIEMDYYRIVHDGEGMGVEIGPDRGLGERLRARSAAPLVLSAAQQLFMTKHWPKIVHAMEGEAARGQSELSVSWVVAHGSSRNQCQYSIDRESTHSEDSWEFSVLDHPAFRHSIARRFGLHLHHKHVPKQEFLVFSSHLLITWWDYGDMADLFVRLSESGRIRVEALPPSG